ncbi:MAG: VWA domain-containing protein [Bacteroidales bacterium]|nr:VWA domain-containing protein [Bacteroidales bacterium]
MDNTHTQKVAPRWFGPQAGRKSLLAIRLALCVCLFFALQASVAVSAHAQQPEKTRLLVILDCSNSMWDHWQSDSKIKVTQQVLLSFLDSAERQSDIDVALRVFGHLNKESYATRLEVPFGYDNYYRIRSKIKTLVPQGGCTAATALTDALDDFPHSDDSRNIILIITDGMDDCDADICDVARHVQLSGVVVKTFILGIGNREDFRHSLDCAGKFTYVSNEESYASVLYDIFGLSDKKARVVLRLLDEQGALFENELPVTFYDNQTGVARLSTLYAYNYRRNPDTLTLDPLVSYDVELHTSPAIRLEGRQFSPERVNELDVRVAAGSLAVRFDGRKPAWQIPAYNVNVRSATNDSTIKIQAIGDQTDFLAGRYDIEVQCLPPITLRGIEVKASSATDLALPMPGLLQLGKPRAITTGAVLKVSEGVTSYVCNLNPNNALERIVLQPGEYEVLLHPQGSADYDKVQSRRFVIVSGQTTKIQF